MTLRYVNMKIFKEKKSECKPTRLRFEPEL